MADFSKVLIANRGEIAVRVIQAARDEGLTSVAIYAEPDRDAEHVRLADETYPLEGTSAQQTYLSTDQILEIARAAAVDALHPGYGFLSENADFAESVIAAGIVWIGPPPEAIRTLGDKVSARGLARQVGAPLVPGTQRPVRDVSEVYAFAEEHGLPIAIKAAHGGGGRGIKVVRRHADIGELYESAVREAVAAFGRGECFVERYLDSPRHVETQCLADAHGDVVVISTRDCSLQRRNQKLVEEAPAPFLSGDQEAQLLRSSKGILRAAGYRGAGTCEFLVGKDGTISFLEVNTRLQVEHPVSEEITGIDLVREQFRIARGEALGYGDPQPRGHSLEFRITCEDPGRDFMPSPGRLDIFSVPLGPGVRIDSGVRQGETISGAFDSMFAKLIVTGVSRLQALQRARRALQDMRVEGVATVLPFHRAVVIDPAFAPELAPGQGKDDRAQGRHDAQRFAVHTRWIETEFENSIPPYESASVTEPGPARIGEMVVELHGRDVRLDAHPSLVGSTVGTGRSQHDQSPSPRTAEERSPGDVPAPMQGTVVSVAVNAGAEVVAGETLVVIEAMKMEQPIAAPLSGTLRELRVAVGDSVSSGQVIAEITAP